VARERVLPLLQRAFIDVAFRNAYYHTYVFVVEGKFLKLDGHIGRGIRGEAEVISEAMAGVG
jgi:hypothetical protein